MKNEYEIGMKQRSKVEMLKEELKILNLKY